MEQRNSISGGSENAQRLLQTEVKTIPMEERQKLLLEAGIGVEMNATQALAIKANLAIPWYKLMRLKSVMKEHHLQIAPSMMAQELSIKRRKKK